MPPGPAPARLCPRFALRGARSALTRAPRWCRLALRQRALADISRCAALRLARARRALRRHCCATRALHLGPLRLKDHLFQEPLPA